MRLDTTIAFTDFSERLAPFPAGLLPRLADLGDRVLLGTDFPTPDGSAIRDYVHVADLARAHLLAGEMLLASGGTHQFNLGTGIGTSVLELLDAVARAAGQTPAVRNGPRRAGDPPVLVASFAKAEQELGWRPRQSDIDFIIDTALRWHDRLAAAEAVAHAAVAGHR